MKGMAKSNTLVVAIAVHLLLLTSLLSLVFRRITQQAQLRRQSVQRAWHCRIGKDCSAEHSWQSIVSHSTTYHASGSKGCRVKANCIASDSKLYKPHQALACESKPVQGTLANISPQKAILVHSEPYLSSPIRPFQTISSLDKPRPVFDNHYKT